MPWEPKYIRAWHRTGASATETAFVTTDAGPGYLKAMGNKGGPHLLAADLVATQLARWLGLPTFEFALVPVSVENDIPLGDGRRAEPGPAFITRAEMGFPWGGDAKTLDLVVNPIVIPRLVVFDTWTRNWDRWCDDAALPRINRDNVFLTTASFFAGSLRLVAMDHTHCFSWGRALNAQLAQIDHVQDERIYGLFPEFHPYVRFLWRQVEEATSRLLDLKRPEVEAMIAQVLRQWQVEGAARAALATLICARAQYVATTIGPALKKAVT